MADITTIGMPRPKWVADTIRSRDVTVKSSTGTIAAKPGHLVFRQEDGTYKAYPVSTAASAITETGYVGVLGQEVTLTTTGAKARVIESGIVYIEAIRDAGITSAKIGDEVIRTYTADRTAIVFDEYTKETVKYGY
jgi:hypothetical protein